MRKRLLAVFGGGAQMLTANGPWAPTPDFEIWPIGPGKGRSLVRLPFDDDNPDSVLAMGERILEAGVIYHNLYHPDSVAIAYGDNSPSLLAAGHPSENQVMSNLFQRDVISANLERFDPAEWNSQGKLSGTYHEAANLLRLVRRDSFSEMIILRREAHLRATVFTMIRLNEPEFADLKERVLIGNLIIREETVESILLRVHPQKFGLAIARIRDSKSYQRTLLREGNALMNFGKGATQIVQQPTLQPASVGIQGR